MPNQTEAFARIDPRLPFEATRATLEHPGGFRRLEQFEPMVVEALWWFGTARDDQTHAF